MEGHFLDSSRETVDNVFFWQNFYATGYTFGVLFMRQGTGCGEICHIPRHFPSQLPPPGGLSNLCYHQCVPINYFEDNKGLKNLVHRPFNMILLSNFIYFEV